MEDNVLILMFLIANALQKGKEYSIDPTATRSLVGSYPNARTCF